MIGIRKKGQAALEFLTTYGWAFMVILVMIAALAYFGVLNPQNLVPDQCVVTSGFTCRDFQVTTNGIAVAFVNNMGEQISINSITYSTPNEANVTNSTAVVIGDGAQVTLGHPATSWGLAVGQKVKIAGNFLYTKSSGTFPHAGTMTITATVQ